MGVYSGNRTLLGESTSGVIGSDHVLEMVLEAERNDMNMFNAVINLDFTEAYCEAGIAVLTEEEVKETKEVAKKSIIKKIKDLITTAIKKIKEFVATFVAKISNLCHNDMKLVKEYRDSFNKNAVGHKLDSFTILHDKAFENVKSEIAKVVAKHSDYVAKITDSMESEKHNEIVDEARKFLKEYDYTDKVNSAFFGEKKEDYTLTEADKKIIVATMTNSRNFISRIKKHGDEQADSMKTIEKNNKYEASYNKLYERADIIISSLNAQYKLAAEFSKFLSKMTNASCNAAARYLAACRRVFVVVGKKKSAVDESAVYDYILAEASDNYVEAKLLGL